MVREEHFQFESNRSGIRCHAMRWIPEGEVRAVVQLVHGMAEHIERYREFAQFLAQRGILVTGHDHLGHGRSAAVASEYGYFAKSHGDRMLIRDMHHLYRMTKQEYPDVPYVMFGHSMGSFLTREYLCCFGRELDGAVICATGSQPEALLRTALFLCRVEAAALGWQHRSKLFSFLTSGSFNLKFRPNRTKADWLSRNEENVDRYLEDPMCGFDFTLNGYYNLFLVMFKAGRKEYLERMPRSLPVLFLAGEEDPVGNAGKGVRRVEKMFLDAGMRNVECRLYPGDRHEILNEDDRMKVFEDAYDWMERSLDWKK